MVWLAAGSLIHGVRYPTLQTQNDGCKLYNYSLPLDDDNHTDLAYGVHYNVSLTFNNKR